MFEIENNEVEEGTILQVVQEGFKIEDRLLRPAMVGVSKKKAE
jgi:molecular chaperone GrpE